MWDTRMVAELTDDVITRDQVLTIISNYDELMKKYPQVREI